MEPILTIMFNHILRTFEVEIFRIVKNIQPQPQTRHFYTKNERNSSTMCCVVPVVQAGQEVPVVLPLQGGPKS